MCAQRRCTSFLTCGCAIANIWRAPAPGGVLLLTVPAMGRARHACRVFITTVSAAPDGAVDWLVADLAGARATIATYGNVVSCTPLSVQSVAVRGAEL